jgi:YD repeat-containing protein
VPGLSPTTNVYDTKGRLTLVSQGARTASYTYDARGRVASITDALSRTTEFTYDTADRLAAIKRPDGRQVGYSYDIGGDMLSLQPPGKAAHSWAYTPRNVLSTYTPPLLSGASTPTTYTSTTASWRR